MAKTTKATTKKAAATKAATAPKAQDETVIGEIQKRDDSKIIVRLDSYKGKAGITVREFITSENYTGFTKAGFRLDRKQAIQLRKFLKTAVLTMDGASDAE